MVFIPERQEHRFEFFLQVARKCLAYLLERAFVDCEQPFPTCVIWWRLPHLFQHGAGHRCHADELGGLADTGPRRLYGIVFSRIRNHLGLHWLVSVGLGHGGTLVAAGKASRCRMRSACSLCLVKCRKLFPDTFDNLLSVGTVEVQNRPPVSLIGDSKRVLALPGKLPPRLVKTRDRVEEAWRLWPPERWIAFRTECTFTVKRRHPVGALSWSWGRDRQTTGDYFALRARSSRAEGSRSRA